MNILVSTIDNRDFLEFEMQDAVGNEYRYQLTDRGAVVRRCRARAAEAEVPAAFEGVPVVEIAPEAFAASEKFALPGRPAAPQHASQRVSQTYLDLRASARNGQLERVVLPEGVVAIGRAAFRGCNRLAEVALPDSLESIDDLAFSCTALKAVRLPRACRGAGRASGHCAVHRQVRKRCLLRARRKHARDHGQERVGLACRRARS